MPSSRVIVKNLPGHVTEQRLREIFGEKGTITDVKLMYTRAGVFRRFAFIGFSSVEEAVNATNYFDKSFIDTSKIVVEGAKSLDDPSLSRPWSIYSAGSSAYQKSLSKSSKHSEEEKKKSENVEKEKEGDMLEIKEGSEASKLLGQLSEADKDKKLQEFLYSMTSRSKKQIWSNDDEGLAFTNNNAVLKKGEVPLSGDVGATVEKEGAKATEFENADNSNGDESGKEIVLGEGDREVDHCANEIIESGRLFIRNLSYSCTEEQLRALFCAYGNLSDVHISIDTETKQSKGLGFVTFLIPEQAVKAYMETDGMSFQGRLLHVLPAKGQRELEKADGQTKSFKQQKEDKLKADANMDYNWNTLFLRSDTVADAISSKLNIKKSELFNVESDSMAVRLALSETHIIADTKKYLEEEGIVMEGLQKNVRSKTAIIVKNIPHATTDDNIFETFSRFGTVNRVILPPTKTIAVVVFAEPSEARSAFRKLAYSKFLNVPLYLEWAPENMVQDKPVQSKSKGGDTAESTKTDTEVEGKSSFKGSLEADIANIENSEGTTVFAKNLNFSTDEKSLQAALEGIGKIRSVTVAKKKDKKNPEKMLSMGFGFVEYETHEEAMECIKRKQGCVVDGHKLDLKLSTRTSTAKKTASKAAPKLGTGTKLMVRNVPFEATKAELKTLFGTFGQFKTLRLPKKFDGTHRGFCFVEYLTKQEAKNAYESLSSTHLYGRHLVLEWADDEQSLEALREKTDLLYSALEKEPASKKRKIEMPVGH